jgi:hypothetical protein
VPRDALEADIAAERTGLPIAESGGALEDEGGDRSNVDDRTYAKVRLDAGSTDAARRRSPQSTIRSLGRSCGGAVGCHS